MAAPGAAQELAGDFFSDTTCKIAMTSLDRVILSFGLGAQWNDFVQNAIAEYQPLKDYLGLPENFTNYRALIVGYPKYKYHLLPTRNEPQICWAN